MDQVLDAEKSGGWRGRFLARAPRWEDGLFLEPGRLEEEHIL